MVKDTVRENNMPAQQGDHEMDTGTAIQGMAGKATVGSKDTVETY